MSKVEKTYNYLLKNLFIILNPLKKSIIETKCIVHKTINIEALEILKNNNYIEAFDLLNKYIHHINKGVVWADQDFKSSNHFYSPHKLKGMYGRSNAMNLGKDYYDKAINLWSENKFNSSMFYLGAALHIIQDMTVPQHANIRLLGKHRQYETFVKQASRNSLKFQVTNGPSLKDSVEDYISFNAMTTINIYNNFKKISDNKERHYEIAKFCLPLAKRTTAGAMTMFYNDIINIPQLLTGG